MKNSTSDLKGLETSKNLKNPKTVAPLVGGAPLALWARFSAAPFKDLQQRARGEAASRAAQLEALQTRT